MSTTCEPSLGKRVFALDALPYVDEAHVNQDSLNDARREIAAELKRMPISITEYERRLFHLIPDTSDAYKASPMFRQALSDLTSKKTGKPLPALATAAAAPAASAMADTDDDAAAAPGASRARPQWYVSDPTPAELSAAAPPALSSAALAAAAQAARLRNLELLSVHGPAAWARSLDRASVTKAALAAQLAAETAAGEAATERRYRLQAAAAARSDALLAEFGRLIDGNYQVRVELERVHGALAAEKGKRRRETEADASAGAR